MPPVFFNHSRRWDWSARAGASDRAVQAEDDRILLEERQSAERLRQRRQVEARQACWELGKRIVDVANRMLDAAGGGEWGFADLARLAMAAEKLARTATEPFSTSSTEQGVGARIAGTFRLWSDDGVNEQQTSAPQELLLDDMAT